MITPRLSHTLAIALSVVILAGCQTTAQRGTPSAPSAVAPSTKAGPSTPVGQTPMPGLDVEPSKAWLLVGRPEAADLQLILSTTGEVGMEVPAGAPRNHWDRVVTVSALGDSTIVRDEIVQPGFGGPELRVAGHWQLPTVGHDPTPVGRSLDGSTIALVESQDDQSAGMSRFAVLEHALMDQVQTAGDAPLRLVRIIELPGAFEYDTLSPDGRILYVIQHLDERAGGRYQVRAVDVSTGVMRDAVIVDKGNPDETMAGAPIAQLRREDGLVLTLYDGPAHPFIHALMSTEAWAVCIDLPADGSFGAAAAADPAAALDWGVAENANGATVYAANASLGIVVEIDPAQLTVRRSASIDATAAAPRVVLAKFGHGSVGPTGRRVIVSPDGATLYAAGGGGVVAIRTKDLTVARHSLAGSAIDALGITTPGTVLFALVHGSGEIVALDAVTGQRLSAVPGSYDRLLAISPW